MSTQRITDDLVRLLELLPDAVQRQLDRGMVPMMLPVMHVAEGRRAQPSESLAHVDGHGNDC